MTRIAILLFLFLLQVFSLLGQSSAIRNEYPDIQYQNFGLEEGLSDNSINYIFQDHNDILWIGTKDGLNKYDGYSFTVYQNQAGNFESLSNNLINHITEDQDGYLWISTEGGLNIFDPSTETFRVFQHDPNNPNSIDHNSVNCTYFDAKGRIWVGTFQSLNLFDPIKETFQSFQYQIENPVFFNKNGENDIKAIIETAPDSLLLGSWCQTSILGFDVLKEQFFQAEFDSIDKKERLCIKAFHEAPNGSIWSIDRSMLKTKPKSNHFDFVNNPDIKGPHFCILPLHDGHFAVGAQSGMYLTDAEFNIQQHFLPFENTSTNQNKNSINTIYEDRAGDLWLGSLDNGLYYINRQEKVFQTLPRAPDNKDPLSTNTIRAIADDGAYLWIAMRKTGLYRFHKFTSQYVDLPYPLILGLPGHENSATTLFQEEEGLLIGTWGSGLVYYDLKNQKISHHSPALLKGGTKGNFISDLKKSPNGGYYIAAVSGIWYAPSKAALLNNQWIFQTKLIQDPNNLNTIYTKSIQVLKSGQIAFGTKAGLTLYDEESKIIEFHQHDPKNNTTLSGPSVNDIFEDSAGNLWVATNNGLNKMDKSSSFQHFNQSEGLQNNYISSITEDQHGNLWLGTKLGISQYKPSSEQFINYASGEGLVGNEFTEGSILFSEADGKIYAGGKKGLSFFNPNNIQKNILPPKVLVKGIKIYSTKNGATIEQNIPGASYQCDLNLNYWETVLQIELSALNFRSPEKNQYAYWLEGLNPNWIPLGNKRNLTLSNLDPGNYTLWIKGSNNDQVWSIETPAININISPPWWRSNLAYFSYFLLIIGSILLFYRILLKRQALRHALTTEQAEASRLKELDHFKSKLYTNLTHEFRTPLTVIIGMIQQIKAQPKQYLNEGARVIQSNGQNLLQLVNQLLDLSKLEDQVFQLQLQQADIIRYLRYLTESFKTYANSQNLSLRFFSKPQQLVMDFDPEQIKQIISNLLFNAVKFTPSGGEIQLRVDQQDDNILIEVVDNGIGIAPKHLNKIFDRFYQVDDSLTKDQPGTGIGLAHTHELVKIMDGQIEVKSQLKQGTQFLITLPISNKAPLLETGHKLNTDLNHFPSLESSPSSDHINTSPHKQQADLLIIEDNPDVVLYLKSCLVDRFNLHIAYNGKIGVDKALDLVPDIIISDVMMPEMNGYEVCETLKTDIRTSHIPIILLTAKADKRSKINGLKTGADSYLFKPFEKEELLVRLDQLLGKQKRMLSYFKQKYQAPLLSTSAKESLEKSELHKENKFLKNVIQIIEQNYADESFALPKLCQALGMSRSQVFRKMKALTGLSPSYYIRRYRLNKAKALLELGQHNVSEVAYQVGFKELTHFSKAYKEAFGHSASTTHK